jgi:alkylated DNA nucleotide flippase Atl1
MNATLPNYVWDLELQKLARIETFDRAFKWVGGVTSRLKKSQKCAWARGVTDGSERGRSMPGSGGAANGRRTDPRG